MFNGFVDFDIAKSIEPLKAIDVIAYFDQNEASTLSNNLTRHVIKHVLPQISITFGDQGIIMKIFLSWRWICDPPNHY